MLSRRDYFTRYLAHFPSWVRTIRIWRFLEKRKNAKNPSPITWIHRTACELATRRDPPIDVTTRTLLYLRINKYAKCSMRPISQEVDLEYNMAGSTLRE